MCAVTMMVVPTVGTVATHTLPIPEAQEATLWKGGRHPAFDRIKHTQVVTREVVANSLVTLVRHLTTNEDAYRING